MPTIKAKMIYTGTGVQLDGAVSWKGKTLMAPDVAAKDIVAEYEAIGVDELIVPDFTLGSGDQKRATMDTFIGEVAGR